MVDDSEQRVRRLLREAQLLVGEGEVRLEVVSAPVIEWVYVGLESDQVVVSDKGATFAQIAGVHGDTDEYVEWSPERAVVPARTFGVSLVDEANRTHGETCSPRVGGSGDPSNQATPSPRLFSQWLTPSMASLLRCTREPTRSGRGATSGIITQ